MVDTVETTTTKADSALIINSLTIVKFQEKKNSGQMGNKMSRVQQETKTLQKSFRSAKKVPYPVCS